jgi:hypothetical protein
MFEFVAENWATIVVGIAVFAIIAAVAVKLIRDKKRHKSSCGCGCDSCPMSGGCKGRH